MASVLTDQVLRAKLLTPVAGLVGTASKTVQFSTPFGQTGNASINVSATNRVTGNPFRVRVSGTLTNVVAQASVVSLNLDGTSIATISSPATASTTPFHLVVEALFVAPTQALIGTQSGFSGVVPKAATTLAANPVVDLTQEGHLLTLSVNSAATDAGFVLTVTEFSLEVL